MTPNRLRQTALLIAGALLLIGGALGLRKLTAENDAARGSLIGRPAPEITLTDSNGQPQRLSQWRGQLLLVNFWATWCAPCVHEIPLLIDAQARWRERGFQVIGPALDDSAAAATYASQIAVNYPILLGDAQVSEAMKSLGDTLGALPYSVLIGRDGTIIATQHGEFSKEDLHALIERHLQ